MKPARQRFRLKVDAAPAVTDSDIGTLGEGIADRTVDVPAGKHAIAYTCSPDSTQVEADTDARLIGS